MLARKKIVGLMTALLVLSVPMVYADNGPGDDKDAMHHDGDWHHHDMEHMMAKILGLSDDQVKQLKDLHKQQKDAMKSTFEQIKSNREAFDAEIVKASPDSTKINDLQSQFKTIQAQMVDAHLNSILAVKKVLTPEQFAGYMALKKERKMMMYKRVHGGFGHKDGAAKDGHKSWGDGDHHGEDQD